MCLAKKKKCIVKISDAGKRLEETNFFQKWDNGFSR